MRNGILDVPDKLENSVKTTTFQVEGITNNNNLKTNINQNIEHDLNNNIDTSTNCLALTVRENYQIVAVKNLLKKSFRISWKIVLSTVTINFLNMFL